MKKTKKPQFFVRKVNTFVCDVSLGEIKQDLKKKYKFTINNSEDLVEIQLELTDDDMVVRSIISYDFPMVHFDEPVAYGVGCGETGFQYVFDFAKNIVYIIGEDISPSLGLTTN